MGVQVYSTLAINKPKKKTMIWIWGKYYTAHDELLKASERVNECALASKDIDAGFKYQL